MKNIFYDKGFFLISTLRLGYYDASTAKSATKDIGAYEVSFFWSCALNL